MISFITITDSGSGIGKERSVYRCCEHEHFSGQRLDHHRGRDILVTQSGQQ